MIVARGLGQASYSSDRGGVSRYEQRELRIAARAKRKEWPRNDSAASEASKLEAILARAVSRT
jgi:hypothetical protein